MEMNTTQDSEANATEFLGCPSDSTEERLAKLVAFGILLFTSLIGNVLTCLVVYKNISMRTTINYLLVNMAVSDLATPLLVASRKIVEISTGSVEWWIGGLVGHLLCKIVFFLSDISPMVSILSLVLISFDRFIAVVVPFKAARYPKKLRIYFIAFTWMFSFVFCAPFFYFLGVQEHPGKKRYCVINWDDDTRRAYSVPLTVTFIIVPFTLLIIMYSCILYKMKTQPRDVSQTEKGKKRSQASKRNITILSFTVMLIFALCWCPYFAVVMLSSFKWNWTYNFCSYLKFTFTVQFLAYANAAINPILYFLFLKNFRAALKNLFSSKDESERLSMRRRSSTTQLTKDTKEKLITTSV